MEAAVWHWNRGHLFVLRVSWLLFSNHCFFSRPYRVSILSTLAVHSRHFCILADVPAIWFVNLCTSTLFFIYASVYFIWVPSHVCAFGNDIADSAANAAFHIVNGIDGLVRRYVSAISDVTSPLINASFVEQRSDCLVTSHVLENPK